MKALAFSLLFVAWPASAQLVPYISLWGQWERDGAGTVTLPVSRQINPQGVYTLRKTVSIPAGIDTAQLAVAVPTIRGAFRLSVNDVSIGETERYAERFEPIPQFRLFAIPPGLMQAGEPAQFRLEISLRGTPDASIIPGQFIFASAAVAEDVHDRNRKTVQLNRVVNLFYFFPELLLAVLMVLVAAQRNQERAAMWLSAFFLIGAASDFSSFTVGFLPSYENSLRSQFSDLFSSATMLLLAEFLVTLLGAPFRFWRIAVYAISLSQILGIELGPIPLTSLPVLLLAVWLGWRRSSAIASVVAVYCLLAMSVADRWFGTGPTFTFSQLTFPKLATFRCAIGLILLVLLVRRLLADSQERQRLASELEAARAIQQSMIPTTQIEGIETVYLPAAEVGGDFWQCYDGRLIVVGDVSGKGLKAAMTVSMVTGALANRRSDAPAALLAELNRVLVGKPGFITCCVVRLEPDGRITVANAGHPAPYLNGQELDLPAGLPLGITADADYTETSLPLTGRLTLLSDGVPEAANPKTGELLGFDRTAALSTKPAAEIAEAARAWGQTDDITVVTIRSTAIA